MYHSPPLTPLSPPPGPTSPPLRSLQAPLDSPLDSTRFSDHSLDQTDSNVFTPAHERFPSPFPVSESGQTGKTWFKAQDGAGASHVEEGDGVGAGTGRRLRPNSVSSRKPDRETIKRKVLLGSRIFAFLFCLISFSIMAADKNQGWALDSFHHYKEFRYCMTVNVLGSLYSGLQAYDLAYPLIPGRYVTWNQLRYVLDFSIDQILTYLLLSSSSSSASRVEDWESNWGKDKFPSMARASVAVSFLAFLAFALSSLISGFTCFTPNSS